MVISAEKWRKVQERLAQNDILADVSQIRSKWERLASEFKKVENWNKQFGNEPYSSLFVKDRQDNKLPKNFPDDIFDAMDVWMHRRHSVNAGLVSENDHSVVDGDIHTPTDSINRTPEQNDQDKEEEAPVEQPPIVPPNGRSLPPDATGVSNSGKRKKFVTKQDVVVDAIVDFSTQLVDVERSRQACEFEQLCPPDSSIFIGVLCAIQTFLEYYEEEEEMLSEGPAKRLKTSGIYLLATLALSQCFPAIVAQFLLMPSAIASGDRFGIGESTVQEIMREGVEAIIAKLGPEYLKWPSTSEMIKVSNGFQLRSGLPNVQDAVDGTFIHIRALQTGITSDVSWASKIVHACCVLQNLLVKHHIAASIHILDEVEAQLDCSVAGTTGHRLGDSCEEVEPASDGYNVGSTPTLAEKCRRVEPENGKRTWRQQAPRKSESVGPAPLENNCPATLLGSFVSFGLGGVVVGYNLSRQEEEVMKLSAEDVGEEGGISEETVQEDGTSEPVVSLPSLLEGLPDWVALQCLARVPLHYHRVLQRVSRAWRDAVQSRELFQIRKTLGVEEEWLYVSAYDPDGLWQAYDPLSDRWTTLPLLPSRIKHLTNFGTAALNGMLYVIGGGSDDVDPQTGDRNATIATNEVWRYDPFSHKWEQMANMLTARSQFACCVFKGRIIVAGGFTNTRKSIPLTEVYKPSEDTWEPLAELDQVPNAACSGIVVEDKVHVVHKGVGPPQVYDAEENMWTVSDREWSWGKMAVVNQELYVVRHGFVIREQKQPALKKSLCSWPDCQNRISFGVVGLGTDLYVIGGIMGPRPHALDIVALNDVDICNVGDQNPTWRKGASMTVSKGSVLGCAVLKR
ncbi:hypothetical protein R1flu_015594 [Riccia fluitans]|uniref:F-box domain-containing protein n=1 Tax=Riccia fluitans TaxID=41844 RepID=A0ABD1YJU8_9MARC